ncbi:hypothetical protein [Streptomyces sp. BE133]|uniref:hypothetical protein n=1 Tax=Streptomyces sp. BE133 TaxID=3002523 RepID=UPI002E79E240|nr:hypothetical protein [Streptomyces sp. BE133]MEE1807054.1 hypothetical protein [Streptomyces sp. BE133]
MRKAVIRYVLTPATALALAATLTTSADAVEKSVDVAPEAVASDQIATQESADSVVEGPSKSADVAAVDRALGALPEIGADSDVGPTRCDNPVKQWVEVSGIKDYHVPSWWNGTNFKDGPGGSMRVSVEKAGKIGVEVSGSGGVSGNVIVAEVKAEYSVKVVVEVGVTVGHTYTHSIPAKKYGHMQYGSWGKKVNWAKYKTSSDRCSKVKIGSGTAKLPTKATGWRYWTTNS